MCSFFLKLSQVRYLYYSIDIGNQLDLSRWYGVVGGGKHKYFAVCKAERVVTILPMNVDDHENLASV